MADPRYGYDSRLQMSPDPILLLHGQPGGIRDWDRVIAALGPDAAPIPIYRPGWDGHSRPLDLRGNADAAAAALDRAGVARATVVGHSLGAGVAAWLAVAHPDRVGALVLASPGANTAVLDGFDRALAAPILGAWLSAGGLAGIGLALALAPARRLVAQRLGLDEDFLRAGSRLLLRPAAWHAFVNEQRALFKDLPALEERLAEIAVPTTIVSGSADRIVTPRAARLLAEQIPGAELELIEGAGHLLPHQHGPALAAIVARAAARA
jgi:pimeloyl-ACP methyl ester carboxylesterase